MELRPLVTACSWYCKMYYTATILGHWCREVEKACLQIEKKIEQMKEAKM